MKASSTTYRMQDLCEITSAKRIFAADYVDQGVPFYRGKEITEKFKGNQEVSTELFITEARFTAIERKFGAPLEGDLLLTSVGTLGSPYVVQPGERFYFKDGNLTWFRRFQGLDSRYLYYWLVSPAGRAELKKCTIGSSQSAYTIALLKGMEIDLPDLSTQRRIAGILSAYDELIANNQRRIAILEEMARALYREWFVHYRAPGVVMGDDGVPEGWEEKPLLELANVTYGFPFDSKQFNTAGEGTPIIRIRDIPTGATETFTKQDAAEKYHVYDGEILVGMDGDFHMCMWSSGHAFQNQRVAKFTSRGAIGNYHLFLALEQPIQALNRSIVGTTVAHLGASHIRDIKVTWPTADIAERFKAILEPMAQHQLTLKKQTANLRRTRDLLLPRLMSGRVEVKPHEVNAQ